MIVVVVVLTRYSRRRAYPGRCMRAPHSGGHVLVDMTPPALYLYLKAALAVFCPRGAPYVTFGLGFVRNSALTSRRRVVSGRRHCRRDAGPLMPPRSPQSSPTPTTGDERRLQLRDRHDRHSWHPLETKVRTSQPTVVVDVWTNVLCGGCSIESTPCLSKVALHAANWGCQTPQESDSGRLRHPIRPDGGGPPALYLCTGLQNLPHQECQQLSVTTRVCGDAVDELWRALWHKGAFPCEHARGGEDRQELHCLDLHGSRTPSSSSRNSPMYACNRQAWQPAPMLVTRSIIRRQRAVHQPSIASRGRGVATTNCQRHTTCVRAHAFSREHMEEKDHEESHCPGYSRESPFLTSSRTRMWL